MDGLRTKAYQAMTHLRTALSKLEEDDRDPDVTLAERRMAARIRNATENFQTPQSEPRATATEILSKATGRSLDTQELNKSVRAFAFGYLDLWDRIRKEVSETTVFSELKDCILEKKIGRIIS